MFAYVVISILGEQNSGKASLTKFYTKKILHIQKFGEFSKLLYKVISNILHDISFSFISKSHFIKGV